MTFQVELRKKTYWLLVEKFHVSCNACEKISLNGLVHNTLYTGIMIHNATFPQRWTFSLTQMGWALLYSLFFVAQVVRDTGRRSLRSQFSSPDDEVILVSKLRFDAPEKEQCASDRELHETKRQYGFQFKNRPEKHVAN